MLVTLDGRRLDDDFAPGTTLQALLDHVRRNHLHGRIVVSVAVNGEPCMGEQLTAWLVRQVGDEQVDLQSADKSDLAAAALRQCASELEQAPQTFGQITDPLSSGNLGAAGTGFARFLDVWRVCQQTTSDCGQLLQADLMQYVVDGRPFQEYVDELIGRLRELRDAFEARDAVLLADLMQYEWPEVCASWRSLLETMADQIKSTAASRTRKSAG